MLLHVELWEGGGLKRELLKNQGYELKNAIAL